VNRFHKIILGLVLMVVAFGANLRAETASEPAAPAKHAAAESEKPLVTSYAPALFYLGRIPANAPEEEKRADRKVFANQWPKNFPSIPITNSILYTWVVALVIIVVVRLGTRNMKEVPSGTQNFVEALVGGLKDMCE
jgi:F-type H+-transporting ATPase subunit a